MSLDDLDVVFLAWREKPAMLAAHHAAVAAALPGDWRGSAVLVENAAPPTTSRAARELVASSYPGARRVVLRLPGNHGFGRAMNLALSECRGSYAALVNSDGRPGPEMFATLVAALEARPDAVWAAPSVHGPGEEEHGAGPPSAVEALPGTAIVVRRRAFLDAGGFDPLFFFYHEDFDASRRLRTAGATLLRVPGAHFDHGKDGRSRRGRLLREFWYAVGDQLMVGVHEPSRVAGVWRLIRSRRRSLASHAAASHWPEAAGISAATLAWPLTALLAERRRRRPWDAARLTTWVDHHRPHAVLIELGTQSSPAQPDDRIAARHA